MTETPLGALLREIIERDGPIPVERFMAEALGHPEHGYYIAHPAIGRAPEGGSDKDARGDFVTAPEISQMFGEMIGAWCAVVWETMGAPGDVRLVELGPGRGTLMADVLRTIGLTAPNLDAALDLHLIETSPVLRAAQETALAGRDATWHARFETVPAGPAIVIANEFFDALPVLQFERLKDGWHERRVGLGEDGSFIFTTAPEKTLAPVEEMSVGACFEVCPGGIILARKLARRFARTPGAALIVDYGHTTSTPGDTLQAIRNGERASPLAAPGMADLTAHVDFAALVRAGGQRGSAAHGPVSQRDFLRSLGIETRAERLAGQAGATTRAEIAAALHRLIGTGEMGTLFKVLAIASASLPAPPGFEPAEPEVSS